MALFCGFFAHELVTVLMLAIRPVLPVHADKELRFVVLESYVPSTTAKFLIFSFEFVFLKVLVRM